MGLLKLPSLSQAPFLALYNYQIYANPQTADLVHSLAYTGSCQLQPTLFYNNLQIQLCGPFKITGVYPEQNFCLDFSGSSFPNIYPIFHVSELEPYYKEATTLRKLQLLSLAELLTALWETTNTWYNSQDWVDAIIMIKISSFMNNFAPLLTIRNNGSWIRQYQESMVLVLWLN
ncbi:hypothetical protein H8356DRAFT_1356897 [Neocallimastix lanati (nom. inval.)]|nr:hypothetical protein H8356DRAFT_1356897 [Neocallimastix sp. JGI-2020a]